MTIDETINTLRRAADYLELAKEKGYTPVIQKQATGARCYLEDDLGVSAVFYDERFRVTLFNPLTGLLYLQLDGSGILGN